MANYLLQVIQKVKSLIPSIEINEHYQCKQTNCIDPALAMTFIIISYIASKSKMREHVSKVPPLGAMGYRGASPPHAHFSHRYPGPPPFRGPYPPHHHHPHHAHYPRYSHPPHPGAPPTGPGGYPPPPHFRGGPPGPPSRGYHHSRPPYNPTS